jgi:SNF2 family DNA or RNA helicase
MIKELFEHRNDNYKIYLVNRPEYIEESMILPEMKVIMIISKDSFNIQVLHGVVSHDVLKMLNAGDINGIITKLDMAVDDETNVIEMITRKYQDDLKVKEYELKVAIENPKYNPKHETQSVINKREAIRNLKQKIACIEERIKEVENCPICYDDFANPSVTPCCSNKFCFNCIAASLNRKAICPMCKSKLTIENMIIIKTDDINMIIDKHDENKSKPVLEPVTYDEKLEYLKTYSHLYGKYENMDKIFELGVNNPVRKYLIFTEYESTLNNKVTDILDKWGLTYGRIRGSSISIGKMIESYRQPNDELNVLLINSKYFGSGINLENTSDIIILHKMRADIEMQVIGRAHRYGRTVGLRIWKLYYQNEANN